MERYTRRWLLALLIVSGSLGLGGGARPASAAMPPAHRAHRRPWTTLAKRDNGLPRGLASVLWRAVKPASPLASGTAAALAGSPWAQQAELTSTAQEPNDSYGWGVAVSGNTAAVAASDTPPWPSPAYGAVYLFTRTLSGVWSQQAELLDPGYGGGVSDAFGIAVALQGNTLAVGAPGATGGLGAVYIYERSGTTWSQQAIITPTDATQPENFATALDLSGNTLVVGANYQNNGEGAVYIYAASGGAWHQQAELRYPGRYLYADFGNSVAVWGNTVLVAAPVTPSAFVYARTGTTWSLQAVLSAPHSTLAYFGHDVALWGNTALVGVCCFNGHVNGAVDVFTRSGTTWSLRTTLTPPGGAHNFVFGEVVALNYQTAVVGNGGAYVYVGSGATWTLQAQLIPSDRPPTNLGAAVAIQGNTALVADTGGTPQLGPAAFVFVRGGTQWAAEDTADTHTLFARPG